MRKISVLALFFLCQLVTAQIINFDFETDTLSSWQKSTDGRWGIDSISPISGSKSLRHVFDNPLGGFDAIAHQHNILRFDSTKTVWEFIVRYDYSPSSSNNWAFWLAANQGVTSMYPAGSGSGYILGVNYTGSDDMLKLWYQGEGGASSFLSTAFNWQNSVTPGEDVAIRVERTTDGLWTIHLNKLIEDVWQEIGSASDLSMNESEYIGVYYEYSSTQDRKLWVDDIKVEGLFFVDTVPPDVKSYSLIERNELEIQFSEEIDTSNGIVFLLNTNISPNSIEWSGLSTVVLSFPVVFSENNKLEISGLADMKGNMATIKAMNFNYYFPEKYDIVVTEILADPVPVIGLPESEYVEIFNRSANPLNLGGITLQIDNTYAILPEKTIYPGVYYILVKDKELWSNYPDSIVIEPATMPALRNSGAIVQIYDKYGGFISGMQYSEGLYETGYKQEGGWSLELTDLQNPCILGGNWKESNSSTGGTPGKKNSVNAVLGVVHPPEVIELAVIDSVTLELVFSEPMDITSVTSLENYSVSDGNKIRTIKVLPPFFNNVEIKLESPVDEQQLLELALRNGINGCSGIAINEINLEFGYPNTPVSGDLVINEVLFESSEEVPEFIELYNTSGVVIELMACSMGMAENTDSDIERSMLLSAKRMQLLPGEYVVFTEDKELLEQKFPGSDTENIYEQDTWLSLGNDGGALKLENNEGEIIDIAPFSADMHFPLLFETKGVSLERISPETPGDDMSNWHSAASHVEYATPTKQNSQFIENKDALYQTFSVLPKEISPDNDGYNDVINIQYSFVKPGYTSTIKIFNRNGYLVNSLLNNKLCGVSGSFTWNGLSDDGKRLPMGYYIIYIEAVHPEGEVLQEKLTVLILPERN